MTGTVALGDELSAAMDSAPVTATKVDIVINSYKGTINNPDLIAGFIADQECGFDNWEVDTPKELLGTTCMPDADDKDVLYIDDTADPDVLYKGDEDEPNDANGYPTEIEPDTSQERL